MSHPAVCRVYDIGEVEGQQFLSMEYVDGENLASLQRRIGRRPAGSSPRGPLLAVLALSPVVLRLPSLLDRVLGRGDRRGAFRLALSMFALGVLAWGFAAHHVADVGAELGLATRGASGALLLAAVVGLFYLALEPYVGRLRPHTLVSWTRLLTGGFRDAVVGRDVLVGAVGGALLALALPLVYNLPEWLGQPPLHPRISLYETLFGTRERLAYAVHLLIDSIEISMSTLLLFLLFRLLLGRDRPASAALVVVLGAIQAVGQSVEFGQGLWPLLPLNLLIMACYAWLLLRFGLLAAIVGGYVIDLLRAFPLSPELGSWKGGPTVSVVLLLAALPLFAFRTSLAPATRPAPL